MKNSKIITIVQDHDSHNTSYAELVRRYHDIRMVTLKSLCAEDIKTSLLIIIQIDMTTPESIHILKDKMAFAEQHPTPFLFILSEFSRREIMQANILGASDYIAYPCLDDYFINIMGDLVNKTVEKAWAKLSKIQENALKVSLKIVEDTFSNAASGLEIVQNEVKNSCDLIIDATAKDGLSGWMNAIQQHHSYTYRHSMMVCGYLTSFGMLLGIKKADLQILTVGGMLHDIGKSKTPLEILEKPSQLSSTEWKVMKEHAKDSGEILEKSNWDPVMIDIASHHHEKIDGTGYPHGLKGVEVSDLARITSIADMFSGLIDKRSYKAAMSAEKAIAIMLEAHGHLDIPLVKAFREVALSVTE